MRVFKNCIKENVSQKYIFRAQAVEEALRKDRGCPVEKETLKKERRGGKRPRCYAAPSS